MSNSSEKLGSNIDTRKELFSEKIQRAVDFVRSLDDRPGTYLGIESFDPAVREVITDLSANEVLRRIKVLENEGMEIGTGLQRQAAVLVALASYFEVTYDDRWHPRTKYEDPEYYAEVERRFNVLADTIFDLADIRLGSFNIVDSAK